MTPSEILRGIIAGTITPANTTEWPRSLPHLVSTIGQIIGWSYRCFDDHWREAVLEVLDDPSTGVICIETTAIFIPNRFVTRLLKHPKVYVLFTLWEQFARELRAQNYYTDAIVLIPAERVILPIYKVRRFLDPLIVDVLAHLVPWQLPSTHPDHRRIAKLVRKTRDKPAQELSKLVKSHPCLFGNKMAAFKYLPTHLVRFIVTVNTRPDLGVGDFGPR